MKELYRLDSFEENKFTPIKEVSKVDFIRAEESVLVIGKFNQQFLNYLYFQLNLIEFDKLIKSISDIPITQIDIDFLQSNKLYMIANRVIFNLLGSFKFFVDSTATYTKRKFGKNSVESEDFIKMTNQAFDNYFAYRFLGQLRDHAHHVGFPIHFMPFSAGNRNSKPEHIKGDIRLMVELKIMLSEKKHMNKILYNDLTQLTKDIDVKPLIYELGNIILNMERKIFEMNKTEIEPAINFIENLAREHKNENNKLVIMYDIKTVGDHHHFSNLNMPFDDIDQLNSFRKF